MNHPRVRPNAQSIAANVLDGEVIMVNLEDGAYLSLDGVGCFVWECLEIGADTAAIVTAVADVYQVDPSIAEADVHRLIDSLLAEGAVLPDASASSGDLSTVKPFTPQYRAPELQVYRDMQDLLALDPPLPGIESVAWEEDSTGRPRR